MKYKVLEQNAKVVAKFNDKNKALEYRDKLGGYLTEVYDVNNKKIL